jgi:transcriptional regulator of heat shock response
VDITQRQKKVLMAIIQEFMESADEVGSVALLQKYNLGVSSATVRNEMVRLMEEGLLEKSHISSGRFPTDQAIRMYVKQKLEDENPNPLVTIEIRQGIYRERFSKDSVTNSVLHILSEETNSIAFVVLDGILRYWGLSNIFKFEELNSQEIIRSLVDILEDPVFLVNLCKKYGSSRVSLLIGEESGVKTLEECSIAFIETPFWETKNAYVGILGSKRMDYLKVVPALREVRNALQTSMQGWS